MPSSEKEGTTFFTIVYSDSKWLRHNAKSYVSATFF